MNTKINSSSPIWPFLGGSFRNARIAPTKWRQRQKTTTATRIGPLPPLDVMRNRTSNLTPRVTASVCKTSIFSMASYTPPSSSAAVSTGVREFQFVLDVSKSYKTQNQKVMQQSNSNGNKRKSMTKANGQKFAKTYTQFSRSLLPFSLCLVWISRVFAISACCDCMYLFIWCTCSVLFASVLSLYVCGCVVSLLLTAENCQWPVYLVLLWVTCWYSIRLMCHICVLPPEFFQVTTSVCRQLLWLWFMELALKMAVWSSAPTREHQQAINWCMPICSH